MKIILKDRILVLISIAVLLLWLIPFVGKNLYPSAFNQIYIQRFSIILVSILIALGLVRSAKNYFCSHYSKPINLSYFFGFIALIVYLLAVWSVGLIGVVESYHDIQETTQKEIEIVLLNIENVRQHSDAKTRLNNAYILYFLTGVAVYYLDENSKPVVFQPTEKVESQNSAFKRLFKEKKELSAQLYSLIKDFEFCLIGFISGLLTTLAVCFMVLFKTKNNCKEKMNR